MGLGSGKKPIPDPGVKKAPDPGSKKHRIPDPNPQHWLREEKKSAMGRGGGPDPDSNL